MILVNLGMMDAMNPVDWLAKGQFWGIVALTALGLYLASVLGVWSMVFLAVTIIGANILLGKKLGAIFRV